MGNLPASLLKPGALARAVAGAWLLFIPTLGLGATPGRLPAPALDTAGISALIGRGQLDSAFRHCEAALRRDSGNASLLLLASRSAPEGETSLAYCRRALGGFLTTRQAQEAWFRMGQIHFAGGRHDSAALAFGRSARQPAKGNLQIQALFQAARASLRQAETDRAWLDSAENQYARLLTGVGAGSVDQVQAATELISLRIARGNPEGAESVLEMARAAAGLTPVPQFEPLAADIARLREKNPPSPVPAQPPEIPLAAVTGSRPADSSRLNPASAPPPEPRRVFPKREAVPERSPPRFTRPDTLLLTPANAGTGKYTLQLGAFAISLNAENARRKYEFQRIPARIVPAKRESGGDIYFVRTRRFATRDEAWKYGETVLKPAAIVFYVVEEK